MSPRVLLACVVAAAGAATVMARVNATGAMDVFMLTDCGTCTADRNSIFCTSAASDSNFVSNGSVRLSISDKKRIVGAVDGSKYCWAGTFGSLVQSSGNYTFMLGSDNVLVSLGCDTQNLFYRQCVIPAQMAIILICVGGIVFLASVTCILFYCGCCKCCNVKGDDSRWGMCNRFCPWMPCSDPVKKETGTPSWLKNPVSPDEQSKSLFGRAAPMPLTSQAPAAVNAAKPGAGGASARTLADLKKPTLPSSTTTGTSAPTASTATSV